MIQQILRVTLEFAIRVQRETLPEPGFGALVQRARIKRHACRTAPLDLVRGELVAPAQRVPETSVILARGNCALDQVETLGVLLPARDQYRRQMLERFRVVRVDGDRASCQFDRARRVAGRVRSQSIGVQRARLVVRRRYRMPSTSCNASCSVKTRNEFVRTLPWLLTASDTRVIVSSSGASATTM